MATTRNKVMWQEGMLMRPHHFQQQQRYNDYLDNQRFRAMNDLSWGFTELTLNNELLAQGKIMIDSASGTLPDGTVFSIPDQDALPDPLHPQHFPDERSRNIYLALPVASDVRNEISDGRRIGRYRLNYADVRDLHSEEGDARTLTLGQLTPRIMSGAEDMSAYITLPLCRISDRHADGCGNALSQRTGRHIRTSNQTHARMSLQSRVQMTESRQLFLGKKLDVQQRVQGKAGTLVVKEDLQQ